MINYRWRTYHVSVPEITSLWCAYMQGRGACAPVRMRFFKVAHYHGSLALAYRLLWD
jgi:hypothetical protein